MDRVERRSDLRRHVQRRGDANTTLSFQHVT